MGGEKIQRERERVARRMIMMMMMRCSHAAADIMQTRRTAQVLKQQYEGNEFHGVRGGRERENGSIFFLGK